MPGGYQGGYTGVGIPGGYQGGVLPAHRPAARGEVQTSEAGPVRPCRGLEWVGLGLGRTNGGGDGFWTTLRARSGTRPLPVQNPQNAASWPIGRDLTTFY